MKLIRDKLPEIVLKNEGRTMNTIEIPDNEIINFYQLKLVEEAKEVCSANDNDNLIEELADLQEVLECMLDKFNLKEAVKSKRTSKRKERGSFKKGIIWTP